MAVSDSGTGLRLYNGPDVKASIDALLWLGPPWQNVMVIVMPICESNALFFVSS